jgi:hypothetical protein
MKIQPFLAFNVLLILTFPRVSLADQNESCRATGQLFGMDLGGHELLLESDAGDVSNVHFEDSTARKSLPAGRHCPYRSALMEAISTI